MNRIRLRTGPLALFGAAFVVALVALLPLRLVLAGFALEHSRIAAREATGSVWAGTLHEVRVGRLALGDLAAGLAPLPLALGQARIGLAGPTGHGAVAVSRHGAMLDGLDARIETAETFAPLPITAVDLTDLRVRFVDGVCERASGSVRATLGGDIAGIALPQTLSGTARCEAGALLLPLVSQPGTERVVLHIARSGRYTAELRLSPTDAASIARLTAAGFQSGPGGYGLIARGGL